jgi:hypothetical protein
MVESGGVVRWWSGGFGDFEFGICLEFGIWNLEFALPHAPMPIIPAQTILLIPYQIVEKFFLQSK